MLSQAKKGFTIIEVVIVLVIGAIIMLMVFLVVPQLQRSQRDSRRQQDARQLLAAAEQSSTQNNGTYPTAANILGVAQGFIRNPFNDPNGVAYTFAAEPGSGTGVQIIYTIPGRCGAAGATTSTGATGNQTAVSVEQENGNSFCVEN